MELPMFSDVLFKILDSKRMTQQDLALKSGIDSTSISRYISGERVPTYPHILQIANAIEMDPAMFFPQAKHLLHRSLGKDSFEAPEFGSRIKNFGRVIVYSMIHDRNHEYVTFNCIATENIHNAPVETFLKDYNVRRMMMVIKGEVLIHYAGGTKSIPRGGYYFIEGYETAMSLNQGTILNLTHSGPDCHKVIDEFQKFNAA
jgi:transcriptional regulator with XRE-family HTH domain